MLSTHASKAVNLSLTLRNWLIGCYIMEFEMRAALSEAVGPVYFSRGEEYFDLERRDEWREKAFGRMRNQIRDRKAWGK